MNLGMLIGLILGLFLSACTSPALDQVAGTIANIDLVKQCNELRLEKDRVQPLFEELDDAELVRLEEINAMHRVIPADLSALTAEVRAIPALTI